MSDLKKTGKKLFSKLGFGKSSKGKEQAVPDPEFDPDAAPSGSSWQAPASQTFQPRAKSKAEQAAEDAANAVEEQGLEAWGENSASGATKPPPEAPPAYEAVPVAPVAPPSEPPAENTLISFSAEAGPSNAAAAVRTTTRSFGISATYQKSTAVAPSVMSRSSRANRSHLKTEVAKLFGTSNVSNVANQFLFEKPMLTRSDTFSLLSSTDHSIIPKDVETVLESLSSNAELVSLMIANTLFYINKNSLLEYLGLMPSMSFYFATWASVIGAIDDDAANAYFDGNAPHIPGSLGDPEAGIMPGGFDGICDYRTAMEALKKAPRSAAMSNICQTLLNSARFYFERAKVNPNIPAVANAVFSAGLPGTMDEIRSALNEIWQLHHDAGFTHRQFGVQFIDIQDPDISMHYIDNNPKLKQAQKTMIKKAVKTYLKNAKRDMALIDKFWKDPKSNSRIPNTDKRFDICDAKLAYKIFNAQRDGKPAINLGKVVLYTACSLCDYADSEDEEDEEEDLVEENEDDEWFN